MMDSVEVQQTWVVQACVQYHNMVEDDDCHFRERQTQFSAIITIIKLGYLWTSRGQKSTWK